MQGWVHPGWGAVKSSIRRTDRLGWTTGCAVLLHVTGLLGILFIDRDIFIALTPANLLLMQFLAWRNVNLPTTSYLKTAVIVWSLGLAVEWVGVHTGLLFGSYCYGTALGPRLASVPVLIGCNWFLVLAGSLSWAFHIVRWVRERYARTASAKTLSILSSAVPFMGALIATVFDRLMEPAALRLGFWTWNQGHVPVYNYICWFGVSYLILRGTEGKLRPIATTFTRRLLLIQAIFFVVIGFSS